MDPHPRHAARRISRAIRTIAAGAPSSIVERALAAPFQVLTNRAAETERQGSHATAAPATNFSSDVPKPLLARRGVSHAAREQAVQSIREYCESCADVAENSERTESQTEMDLEVGAEPQRMPCTAEGLALLRLAVEMVLAACEPLLTVGVKNAIDTGDVSLPRRQKRADLAPVPVAGDVILQVSLSDSGGSFEAGVQSVDMSMQGALFGGSVNSLDGVCFSVRTYSAAAVGAAAQVLWSRARGRQERCIGLSGSAANLPPANDWCSESWMRARLDMPLLLATPRETMVGEEVDAFGSKNTIGGQFDRLRAPAKFHVAGATINDSAIVTAAQFESTGISIANAIDMSDLSAAAPHLRKRRRPDRPLIPDPPLSARLQNRARRKVKPHPPLAHGEHEFDALVLDAGPGVLCACFLPFRSVVFASAKALTSANWEVRHGNACLLRALIAAHNNASPGSQTLCEQTLSSLTSSLAEVLLRDRFGDFVLGQLVAPVRETVAQCIALCVAAAKVADEHGLVSDALRFIALLACQIDTTTASTLAENDEEYACGWQLSHAAIRTLCYVAPVLRTTDCSSGGIPWWWQTMESVVIACLGVASNSGSTKDVARTDDVVRASAELALYIREPFGQCHSGPSTNRISETVWERLFTYRTLSSRIAGISTENSGTNFMSDVAVSLVPILDFLGKQDYCNLSSSKMTLLSELLSHDQHDVRTKSLDLIEVYLERGSVTELDDAALFDLIDHVAASIAASNCPILRIDDILQSIAKHLSHFTANRALVILQRAFTATRIIVPFISNPSFLDESSWRLFQFGRFVGEILRASAKEKNLLTPLLLSECARGSFVNSTLSLIIAAEISANSANEPFGDTSLYELAGRLLEKEVPLMFDIPSHLDTLFAGSTVGVRQLPEDFFRMDARSDIEAEMRVLQDAYRELWNSLEEEGINPIILLESVEELDMPDDIEIIQEAEQLLRSVDFDGILAILRKENEDTSLSTLEFRSSRIAGLHSQLSAEFIRVRLLYNQANVIICTAAACVGCATGTAMTPLTQRSVHSALLCLFQQPQSNECRFYQVPSAILQYVVRFLVVVPHFSRLWLEQCDVWKRCSEIATVTRSDDMHLGAYISLLPSNENVSNFTTFIFFYSFIRNNSESFELYLSLFDVGSTNIESANADSMVRTSSLCWLMVAALRKSSDDSVPLAALVPPLIHAAWFVGSIMLDPKQNLRSSSTLASDYSVFVLTACLDLFAGCNRLVIEHAWKSLNLFLSGKDVSRVRGAVVSLEWLLSDSKAGDVLATASTLQEPMQRGVAAILIRPLLSISNSKAGPESMCASRALALLLQRLSTCLSEPQMAQGAAIRQNTLDDAFTSEHAQVFGLIFGHACSFDQTPPSWMDELRSYQVEGISWLRFLRSFSMHGILADDMGIGKTLQTLCAIVEARDGNELPLVQHSTKWPALVVCPRTLIDHWRDEIERWFERSRDENTSSKNFADSYRPSLSVEACIGPTKNREKLWRTVKEGSRPDVLLISYDTLRVDSDIISQIEFGYVVLDEGHLLKNPDSKLSAAARAVQCKWRLILTGTPIQNNVVELWALFDWLMPGYLGPSREWFKANVAKTIENAARAETTPIKFSRNNYAKVKAETTLEALHRQVLPLVLRRTKEEVLPELPPKMVQDIYCELNVIQRHMYNVVSPLLESKEGSVEQQKGSAPAHVFSILALLRAICNHPRLAVDAATAACRRIVAPQASSPKISQTNAVQDLELKLRQILVSERDIASPKFAACRNVLEQCGIDGTANDDVQTRRRALIFSQQRAVLDAFEEEILQPMAFVSSSDNAKADKGSLPERHLAWLRLDGSIPPTDRHAVAQRFNNDLSIDILLLTTRIGGVGLNLTGADTVIFIDHDWNPMVDLQAMDRAHRLGAKRAVNVFRILTRDTLEERIMSLQRFKQHVANTVVSLENASTDTMSTTGLVDTLESAEVAPSGTFDDADTDIGLDVESFLALL